MVLSLLQLQDIQMEAMADDIDIDLERMAAWTAEEAAEFFQSGGENIPGSAPASLATGLHAFQGKLIDGRCASLIFSRHVLVSIVHCFSTTPFHSCLTLLRFQHP